MKPTLHIPASGPLAATLSVVVDGLAAAACSEEIS
jgi:hypothetical protein